MKRLTTSTIVLACAASVGAAVAAATASTQSGQDSVNAHVAAARQAAGSEYQSVFDSLCGSITSVPASPQGARGSTAPTPSTDPPPSAQWHVEPARVFDNLYYLGQTEYTAWAVTTSAGIIVIDPLFDYSVEDEVVNGLTTLGLNPRDIKYVLVSHGHRDHVGGARLLQERYGARVIMSAADWDLVLGNRDSYPKPKRDMVATDGQQLTLGDTSITMYLTPGHTPGTISIVLPVKDQGRSHVAAQWGGTGFNFTITPEHPKHYWYETYARSAARFSDVVAKAGADVQIANHPNQDGAAAKLAALAKRKPGDPHPFVVGNGTIQRYLTMVRECALAGEASSR
jgi:metallo-beta-lactamase class B